MKRIAVIARLKEYARYLRANLEEYFAPYAEISDYSVAEVETMEWIPAEYVLVSAFTIFQRLRNKILRDSELIIISFTVDMSKLEPLKSLPRDTKAYLVSVDYRNCMQVITQLYEVGHRNLNLFPYYGEGALDPDIHLAITPNELPLVPQGLSRVIDIGERRIDSNSLIVLAERLGIRDVFHANAQEGSIRSLVKTTWADRLLGENESLSEQINLLLGLMDMGIVITDMAGKIYTCNDKARRLLRKRSEILEGFDVSEMFPEIDVFRIQESEEVIVNMDGNHLIVGGTQIVVSGEVRGNIISVRAFEKMEETQHQIRTRLSGSAHRAVHHFGDLVGCSRAMAETIETAKRMAGSDSSVMITGESGTGKEVFAQSIHNASRRHNYNFVAVNCAAIPEPLLESEMFGYDEGAFTGAKKGGKIGYFELAHKGTIFLDEIAEMPLQLQSKLLRVIEEKRMVKVGGSKLIDIDIRIIAATNRDLFQMIEESKFREDLYYRLNVLPLHIPGLRERREDIPLLCRHFSSQMGAQFTFSEAAMAAMKEYPWRGNIRELRNLVEYVANLGKPVVDERDIAPAMRRPARSAPAERELPPLPKPQTQPDEISRFIYQQEQRLGICLFVLSQIDAAREQGAPMGRYALLKIARQQGLPYTDQELRTSLKKMQEAHFVLSRRGRGGSLLTQEGKRLLARLQAGGW